MNWHWPERWLDLARTGLETAISKGFEPPTQANFPAKIACVWTEVTEAEDAIDLADPTRTIELGGEMADIAIRVLGILQALWPTTWIHDRLSPPRLQSRVPNGASRLHHTRIETILRPIRTALTRAFEAWRRDDWDTVRGELVQTVAITHDQAALVGIDLLREIEQKIAYNAKREWLHGKKRADT